MRLFSLTLSIFSLFLPLPAFAEEGWEAVRLSLESGEEVVLLPLPSETPSEFLEEKPPPQTELHFSGAQGDGGSVSVAKATLAFPPISVGEQVVLSPFIDLNGQDDGTSLTLAIESGVVLSLGDKIQAKFAVERTIIPFPDTSLQVSGSFQF